jgi:hypothetical protein
MIQPVELKDFILNFFAAAAIILSGAGYALCYASAQLTRRRGFLAAAFVAYGVLALSVGLLIDTAHLDGFWRIVAVLMLLGYFAAPIAIHRLCTATHADEESEPLS